MSSKEWVCKKHKVKHHDVFINYRVVANADTAQALFLTLSAIERSDGKRVQPYLDRYCLEEGRPWEEGFLVGISNAALIILLISEAALEGIKGADKWQDNVLLEYEFALDKFSKNEATIFPVYLGSKVTGPTGKEVLWKDFSAYSTDVYPDAPHKKSGINVRTTMQTLFKIQGLQVTKADQLPSQKNLLKKKLEGALALLKRLGPKKEKVPTPTYATKPVGTWTVDDVKAWCLGSGLKDYEATFTENAVDGSTLLTLTEKDLKTDLKVTKPLIIRKILNTIKEAKGLLEKTTAAEAKKAGKEKKEKKEKKAKPKAEDGGDEADGAEAGDEADGAESGGESGDEEEEEPAEDEPAEDEPADDNTEEVGETSAYKPKIGNKLTSPTHKDELEYKRVDKIAGYKKGWNCDECRANHGPKEPSFHCDKHNYDICIDCSQEAAEAQGETGEAGEAAEPAEAAEAEPEAAAEE